MKTGWIVILALGLIGAATFIPFIKTTAGATTITGTTVTTRAWFGLAPVSAQEESPLANWCRAHGVPVAEDTVVFSRITKNAWGIVWARRDGSRPASYDFTPAMQRDWLARASEAKVHRFIDAMMVTDETSRARLVEAACAQVTGAR